MSPPSTSGQSSSPTDNSAAFGSPSPQQQQQQPDVMASLGNALAGVNLGTGYDLPYNTSSPKDESSGSMNTNTAGGAGQTGGVWGSSSLTHHQTFQSSPASNNNSSSNNDASRGRQNLLFGTDMNDFTDPTSPVRKKSIDLFLSQSPSQTLGEEVLQLQHSLQDTSSSGNRESLNGWNNESSTTGGSSQHPSSVTKKQHEDQQQRSNMRSMDSPSTSVTGGTSASSGSASPSLFHNAPGAATTNGGTPNGGHHHHGTIPAYPPRVNHSMNRIGSAGGTGGPMLSGGDMGMSLQPTGLPMMNHHAPPVMDQHQAYNMHPPMQQQQQQQQHVGSAAAAAAPQVLYMAVPTPDGRGQMLQPIQMVQIPGGAQTFVLPGATTGGGHLPAGGVDASQQQPMMVLPSMAQPPIVTSPVMDHKSNNKGNNQWMTGGNSSQQQQQQFARSPDPYAIDRNQPSGGGGGASDEFHSSPHSNNRSSPTTSATSDAIASLYAQPQRPPLDQLLGHVRRLARDQVGCRLLQQALDEEGPMAATLILNEGISFWGEAMVDPFGNYLFQKIMEKITAEERVTLVKSVSARLVNASLNLHGTRSVQKVVELCAQDENHSPNIKDPTEGSAADILTNSLSPAAARLCIDSHGNHVIQRILLKLGHRHSKFVFDAVAASVGDVARHRHGCCVIQRCLDSPPTEARSHLVQRIVEKCLELMQDAYGNYVVQYVLDVCVDEDVFAVCESVSGKVCLLAIQKFSSNVMEKCLERCTDRTREMYMQELSDPERIRELMMDPFGNYVVQRALSVATHAQAIRLVEAMRPHLISSQPGNPNGQRNGGMRNTAGGRRIMAKICRRFPNFTLTAMGSPEELYSQGKNNNHRKQQQQQHHNHHQQQQHHHQQQQHQHHGHHQGHHQQQQPQHHMLGGGAAAYPPIMAHNNHVAQAAYGASPQHLHHHQGHVAAAAAAVHHPGGGMRQTYFEGGGHHQPYYGDPVQSGHTTNYHPHHI